MKKETFCRYTIMSTPNRILKVNQLIKKELGQIMLKEIHFPEGTLVTLTRVETFSNLIEAKVYISVFPENKSGEILQILSSHIFLLQQKLNSRLKMRPIPKIQFVEETTTREAGRVEELLDKIRKSDA